MMLFSFAGEAYNYDTVLKLYVSGLGSGSSAGFAVHGYWTGNGNSTTVQLSNVVPTKEEAMALLTELVRRPQSFLFWDGYKRKKPKVEKEPAREPQS